LGYSVEEMMNIPLQNILTKASMEEATRTLAEELNNEKKGDVDPNRWRTLELDHVSKTGAVFPAEVNTSFLRRKTKGVVHGILGATRDIRERKKFESQLQTARKMEAIATLAGGVAHDLNNILTGITSYPEYLLLDLPEESPLRESLETIKRSGDKAVAIVQDLLTLSRRSAAVKEVLNINAIVSEYLNSPEYKMLLEYHPKTKVVCTFNQTIKCIQGSRVHILKVIMNMVSNAAEAMPDGGTIQIFTDNKPSTGSNGLPGNEEGQGQVVLKIADTGYGIALKDQQKIFEPFYTKKKMGRSGTGLGMAVVWGTVQDHAGTIEVDSRPGEGTTFTVFFPAVEGHERNIVSQTNLANIMGHGESVLVVDDVAEQREVAAKILRKLNYQVHVVASGEEALAYLQTQAVDLMLLDMIMDPGMDGLATYREALKINPQQKALLASSFSETGRVKAAMDLGAGGYIKKPYDIDIIGQGIRRELDRSG